MVIVILVMLVTQITCKCHFCQYQPDDLGSIQDVQTTIIKMPHYQTKRKEKSSEHYTENQETKVSFTENIYSILPLNYSLNILECFGIPQINCCSGISNAQMHHMNFSYESVLFLCNTDFVPSKVFSYLNAGTIKYFPMSLSCLLSRY